MNGIWNPLPVNRGRGGSDRRCRASTGEALRAALERDDDAAASMLARSARSPAAVGGVRRLRTEPAGRRGPMAGSGVRSCSPRLAEAARRPARCSSPAAIPLPTLTVCWPGWPCRRSRRPNCSGCSADLPALRELRGEDRVAVLRTVRRTPPPDRVPGRLAPARPRQPAAAPAADCAASPAEDGLDLTDRLGGSGEALDEAVRLGSRGHPARRADRATGPGRGHAAAPARRLPGARDLGRPRLGATHVTGRSPTVPLQQRPDIRSTRTVIEEVARASGQSHPYNSTRATVDKRQRRRVDHAPVDRRRRQPSQRHRAAAWLRTPAPNGCTCTGSNPRRAVMQIWSICPLFTSRASSDTTSWATSRTSRGEQILPGRLAAVAFLADIRRMIPAEPNGRPTLVAEMATRATVDTGDLPAARQLASAMLTNVEPAPIQIRATANSSATCR